MTDVIVRSANGSALCVLPLAPDGSVTLPSHVESVIWGEYGAELHRRLDHMEALNSREVHWSSADGAARLRDGTPLTKEIMESWGWIEQPDGNWRTQP